MTLQLLHSKFPYIVQEKSMNMWEKGRVLTLSECEVRQGLVHGTCPGLVEGNEYMFRIKAVNIGQAFPKHIKNLFT
jgi:hypothetical protein